MKLDPERFFSGKRTIKHTLIAMALLLLSAAPVYANTGLPMLAVMWPPMFLALVPVVVIESVVLWRLAEVGLRQAAWACSVANLASTVVGVPITWLLCLLFYWPVGWLLPFYDDADIRKRYWEVPTRALALLIIFFVSSWVIERGVIRRMLPLSSIDWGVLLGNVTTYGLLMGGTLFLALHHQPRSAADTEEAHA